jgi:hypothetical protein
MGLGFEVPNIDAIVKKWDWERPGEVAWESGRVRIQGEHLGYQKVSLSLHIPFPKNPQPTSKPEILNNVLFMTQILL